MLLKTSLPARVGKEKGTQKIFEVPFITFYRWTMEVVSILVSASTEQADYIKARSG